MCLILFAYQSHPQYRLILLANRDEFYARPSRAADFWPEQPQLLAGKDLQAGGTWMGITRQGRFAAITNYRELPLQVQQKKSRGQLTHDFLSHPVCTADYLNDMVAHADDYPGFNLLLDEGEQLHYFSNRNPDSKPLQPGVYGLSNALLNSPWPKVESGMTELGNALSEFNRNTLWSILLDEQLAIDDALPDTGIGLEKERLLSSRFIRSDTYGTRASSILLVSHQGEVEMLERNFDETGELGAMREFRFRLDKS